MTKHAGFMALDKVIMHCDLLLAAGSVPASYQRFCQKRSDWELSGLVFGISDVQPALITSDAVVEQVAATVSHSAA